MSDDNRRSGAHPTAQPVIQPAAPRFVQLLPSWGVGGVTILVLFVATALLSWELVGKDRPEAYTSVSGNILLVHLPAVLTYALGTWAAGAVHRAPSRDASLRHCVALFVPALVVQALGFLLPAANLTVLGVLIALADLVIGCALGFLLDRLRRR
ncbi:hypothetical protein [Streptomyces vilmorinianum]|uniref:hypothetical protein n=1 Tax=Streptomyces vilmorinianum TaxID=3051092 RepID=UPI0010FB0546|nr:hypothetical protein [Streptomyces vilmorinianum]